MQNDFNDSQNYSTENTGRKNLLTIGEASEYLGVSIDTLRRWEKRGRIEAYRSPGGHRHYDKKDLDLLFDKRYVRDEPTIRRRTKTEEEIAPEKQQNNENASLDNNLKPTVPPVTLPAWRRIEFKETITEFNPSTESTAKPLIEEKILDRPVREVRIPEVQRVRVMREEVMLSPQEAYYRQQSASVLTPAREIPPVQHVQTVQPSPAIIRPAAVKKETGIREFLENNKKLVVYGSLAVGLILFILGWYFLWLSSQKVLSPIP